MRRPRPESYFSGSEPPENNRCRSSHCLVDRHKTPRSVCHEVGRKAPVLRVTPIELVCGTLDVEMAHGWKPTDCICPQADCHTLCGEVEAEQDGIGESSPEDSGCHKLVGEGGVNAANRRSGIRVRNGPRGRGARSDKEQAIAVSANGPRIISSSSVPLITTSHRGSGRVLKG